MMEFEAYLEEEEMFETMDELLKLDEACRVKNNPKLLSRYGKQREKAALKNKDFFDKKENKKGLIYGYHFVSNPKTKRFLKKKKIKSNRVGMKNKFKKSYFSGVFDEDIAG